MSVQAPEVARLREEVAWACRILATEGYADLTLGHVSARLPGGSTFAMKRKGVSLEEVAPDDVTELSLDGLNGGPEIHLEVVLHSEVYRARPDVGAVVHAHPPFATAFAAADAKLEFLTHDAVLFSDGLPVFEADTDLITTPEQGAAVAAALGDGLAVALRNHGVLVVGATVRWAVLAAATLERAVRLQTIASTLGELRPLSRESAERLRPVKYRDHFVDEYWDAWVRRLRRLGLGDGMPV